MSDGSYDRERVVVDEARATAATIPDFPSSAFASGAPTNERCVLRFVTLPPPSLARPGTNHDLPIA